MAKGPDVGEEKGADAEVASSTPSGDGQDTSNQDSPTVEELTQRIDNLTTKVETSQEDLNKQKSSLQSTHAAEIRELRSSSDAQIKALEEQTRQAIASSLDDDDREAYEKAWAVEDRGKLESQIEALKNERDMALNMGQYVQAANTLGIDPAKIDTTTPERAYQSMWSGVTELIADLKENNAELEKRTATGAPVVEEKIVAKEPDKVLTTQHSTPSGVPTIYDIRKALQDELGKPITLNDVFDMAEQRPDLEQKLRELNTGQE